MLYHPLLALGLYEEMGFRYRGASDLSVFSTVLSVLSYAKAVYEYPW